MADAATKERPKNKVPTPEELGLIPIDAPATPPPASQPPRVPTPQELGLIPFDEPPPPGAAAPSPKDLGLVEVPEPAGDAGKQEWWDWLAAQAEAAEEEVFGFLDTIREGLGIEMPKPANPDMSRVASDYPNQPKPGSKPAKPGTVPEGKIFEPGSTGDEWVPDDLEWFARSAYDFATSPRTWQALDAGAARAEAGAFDFAGGVVHTVNYVGDWLADTFGGPKSDEAAILPGVIDKKWSELEQDLDAERDYWAQLYEQKRIKDDRTLVDVLVETAPTLPPMLLEFMLGGRAFGAAKGFAAVEAIHARDGSNLDILGAAAKGYALGVFLEWANVLSRPLRIVPLAAAGGGLAYAEGGDDVDIAASAIIFPVLGMLPRSGPINRRYLKEHGVTPDMRDIGGHIRDLFWGGNSGKAKVEHDAAFQAWRKVTARHQAEQAQERVNWMLETNAAKRQQPGDTPEIAGERISRANAQHERNLEEMLPRQRAEELPYRQAFDHAARRWARAKHPWRVSWMSAPYMRNLHMAERGVMVAHAEGYRIVARANEEADRRYDLGMAKVKEFRARAAEMKDPKKRKALEDLADATEDETVRITHEMRSGAEWIAERRIDMAEGAASTARWQLAEVMGAHYLEKHNAQWLAADRDVQEAFRYGARAYTAAARRARSFADMGDAYVKNTEARLRRRGITPENEKTRDLYERVMAEAEHMRDYYRTAASVELLDAQTRADTRISIAQGRYEVATTTAAQRKKRRQQTAEERSRQAKREQDKTPGETKPDDAKKPDDPNWDPAPRPDPVPRGPDFEATVRSILENATRDPRLGHLIKEADIILSRVNDPADVLPAINYIAQKNGYDAPSRRGKQTRALRQEAAKKLGMTEKEFLDSPYGTAFSDAQLEAIIWMLDRQWMRVQTSYEVWKRTGAEGARERYETELYRFMMIWERVRGAAAEAGRALRMFREIKSRYGSAVQPMSDYQYDMIMNAENPGVGMKILRAFHRGRWFDALMEYYVNSLLSSFQTAFVNIFSGAAMMVYRPVQSLVATGTGVMKWTLWNMLGGRYLVKAFKAAYRAAVKMGGSEKAKDRVRQIERDEADGNLWNPRSHMPRERVYLGETGARLRGYAEAIVPASIQFLRTFFLGERYLGEATYGKGMGEHIPWWAGGSIIRLPGRLLQAIDDFFKVLLYKGAVRAHAYRQARIEESTAGKFDYVGRRRRYAELVKKPNQSIMAAAKKEAVDLTFQKQVDPNLQFIPNAAAQSAAFRFLVPFSRTLLNSVEFVLSGLPGANLLFRESRAAIFGLRGRAAQDMAIAHIIITTGVSYALFEWAMDGNIRPASGKDEKAREVQGVLGLPPLSVRLPGTDDWVSVNRVDPMGAWVSIASAAADLWKAATRAGDDKTAQDAFFTFVSAIFTSLLDRSGLKGLVEWGNAFSGGTMGKDADSIPNWFAKISATLAAPQALAVWARTQDPYLRYAEGFIESLWARLPGWREKLWPIRNMWGDAIIGFDSYGDQDYFDLTMPLYWGKRSDDPATKAVVTLYEIYGWAPGKLDRTIEGRELTDEEYDAYSKRVGELAHQYTSEIAKSPEWKDIERLNLDVKRFRRMIKERKNPDGTPMTPEQYKAAQSEMMRLQDELQRRRYKILQLYKKAFTRARKEGRLYIAGSSDGKVPGRFPGIWKRPRKRDDAAKSGETPPWMDDWINADPDEDWDEAEAARAHGWDPDEHMSEKEKAERAKHDKAYRDAVARHRDQNPPNYQNAP